MEPCSPFDVLELCFVLHYQNLFHIIKFTSHVKKTYYEDKKSKSNRNRRSLTKTRDRIPIALVEADSPSIVVPFEPISTHGMNVLISIT